MLCFINLTYCLNDPVTLRVSFQAGEPKEYEYEYYDDTQPESPFVNPHDPNHQNVSRTSS